MLKYTDIKMVFREFPGEVTLSINISGCPNCCPGCHSPYLQKDEGENLTEESLNAIIDKNKKYGITCIGFMGGDNDTDSLLKLIKLVKSKNLKAGWYSGRGHHYLMKHLDYIKIGGYDEKSGSLEYDTTNQILLKRTGEDTWQDITDELTRFHKDPALKNLQK